MKTFSSIRLIIIILFFLLPHAGIFAQSEGSLDLSFGTGGIAYFDNVSSTGEVGYAVAVQPDGKIVSAGIISTGTGDASIAVTRCLPDGSIDSTFGDDGWFTHYIDGWAWSYALCLQDDGRIVVAGLNHSWGVNYDAAVLRLEPDGTFDESFGDDGIVLTNISDENEQTYDAIIQPDGKILLAGFRDNDVNNNLLLIRYNTDGSLDPDFGDDGIVLTDLGGGESAYAITLQSDGKIVAGGQRSDLDAVQDFLIVRYMEDGSLDPAFGTDGYVTTDFFGYADECWEIHIQPDGKIVASGFSFNGTDYDFATARFSKNGLLDTEFDFDGKVTTDFDARNDRAFGSTFQTDGKIIVAGYTKAIPDPYETVISMVRYNEDGSPDTSFDTDGKVNTDAGSEDSYAYAVALQPDGKIVLTGLSENPDTGDGDLVILRYHGPEAPLDISGTINSAQNISVSPNPVGNELHIQMLHHTKQEIIITDLYGNEILRSILTQEQTTVPATDIKPGMYMVTCIKENSISQVIAFMKM